MAKKSLMEAATDFFGFSIKRPKQDAEAQLPSFAPKLQDDGATVVAATGGFYGTYVDLDGTVRTEAELVTKYRDMSFHPEVDAAIEDIANETIITEEGEKTVQILLDDIPNMSRSIGKKIEEEFESVLRLLEFNTKSYNVFRRWYIDGRLYYNVIVDPNDPLSGIKEMRFLDPRRIRKIREVTQVRDKTNPQLILPKTVNEYYIYTDKDISQGGNKSIVSQSATQGIRIAKDSIVHCTSGVNDAENKMVLGFLHKAIKPLNCLRALEDATIIYRISRAPERRVFYVDVGNLPKIKAEQYIRDMMVKHKNKLVYDSATGAIRDDRKFMTMIEDYWMPRREGGRGTQIETLKGGENLGVMEDVLYFQKKLYNSLNVPVERLDPEKGFSFGRVGEVTREEVKFAKFIDRIRLLFSTLFLKTLEKQLILKGLVSPDEWQEFQSEIKFRFLQDNKYAELKDQELLLGRMNVLNLMAPFVGRFYSNTWIRKNLLKQDDEEIEMIDSEISKELTMDQYAPSIDMMNPAVDGGPGQGGGAPPGGGMPQPGQPSGQMQQKPPPGQGGQNGKPGSKPGMGGKPMPKAGGAKKPNGKLQEQSEE